ncbi:MAG: hypothetical protein D6816_13785, partial [Bacteroidetes bacterium]
MGGLSGADLVQKSFTVQDDYVHGDKVGGDKVLGDKYTMQPSLPSYFHLCVIDPENDEQVDQLEPGKQYHIVVWTDTSPNSNQSAIPAQTSLSLLLKVQEPDKAQYIIIPDPQTPLLAEQAQDFEHQFDLITDARLPHGQVTLALQYWPENKRYRKKTISQQLHLAGLIDKDLFNACHINPDMERPQHTAVIHVKYAEDNERIKLTCWGHCANREITTMPFTPPGVKLADFIEAQKDPWEVLGEIFTFSDDTANIQIQTAAGRAHGLTILRWLTAVHARFQNDLQLAIVDHTDTEIPWEMLKLGPEGFLGSLVPVVRWLLLPQGVGHRELEVTPNQCVGSITAYLDEASLPDAAGERQHLSHFDTHFYEDVATFQDSLKQLQPGTGLVYLGCHGMFTPHDIDEIAYGAQL